MVKRLWPYFKNYHDGGRMIQSIEFNREAYHVIIDSFSDVINQYQMTKENCPGNSAFMSYEYFMSQASKVKLFGLFDEGLVGCVAVEKKSPQRYKIKWLSMLFEKRHHGYGKVLMAHAEAWIQSQGGHKVTLGMIYENQVLHAWYLGIGYQVDKIKSYKGNVFQICYMEKKYENI